MERKIRVLIAKPGLDGHDRGAKTIATVLRDHGMEVVYSGLHQTPEMIAETALQEDVDVVGLSILSGAHMSLFPRIRQALIERDMGEVLLTGGGIIPEDDMAALEGDNGIAVGNAIGSNASNIGLVLAVTALVAPVPLHRGGIRARLPPVPGTASPRAPPYATAPHSRPAAPPA